MSFKKNILLLFLILPTIHLAQLDANSVMGLPTVNNSSEMSTIPPVNTGSIIYNIAEEKIFMYNGTEWISCACDLGNRGLQFYTWDTANISMPNINNVRSLGLSTSSGIMALDLGDTARSSVAPDTDGYIIRYIGTLNVKNTGSFTFSARSDDGTRVYIDEVLVVDNWFQQAPTTRTGTINLAKGQHKIEFWYYENAGGDFMEFRWGSNPDGYPTGSIIKASDFFVK